MKKYLMAAVALICMTIVCVSFSACGSDDDETVSLIGYVAEGSVTATGNDVGPGLVVLASYTTAIKQVTGDSYCSTSKDAEVIAACDKLYESQRATYTSWKGTINIKKNQVNGNSSTVIKTYTFE